MSEWRFQRYGIRAFRFVRCEFDAATGVARLVYAFDDGPELIETITVPGAPFALDAARAAGMRACLCVRGNETSPPKPDVAVVRTFDEIIL